MSFRFVSSLSARREKEETEKGRAKEKRARVSVDKGENEPRDISSFSGEKRINFSRLVFSFFRCRIAWALAVFHAADIRPTAMRRHD